MDQGPEEQRVRRGEEGEARGALRGDGGGGGERGGGGRRRFAVRGITIHKSISILSVRYRVVRLVRP